LKQPNQLAQPHTMIVCILPLETVPVLWYFGSPPRPVNKCSFCLAPFTFPSQMSILSGHRFTRMVDNIMKKITVTRWQTWPPLPTPDELFETYASSLILAYSLHEIVTSSTKPEVLTYCTAVGGGPNHGHIARTENLMKFGRVALETCEQRDRQTNKRTTNRHTDRNTCILHTGTK